MKAFLVNHRSELESVEPLNPIPYVVRASRASFRASQLGAELSLVPSTHHGRVHVGLMRAWHLINKSHAAFFKMPGRADYLLMEAEESLSGAERVYWEAVEATPI